MTAAWFFETLIPSLSLSFLSFFPLPSSFLQSNRTTSELFENVSYVALLKKKKYFIFIYLFLS